MQNLHIEILSISHVYEESPTGVYQELQEFLFYPEFSCYGNKRAKIQRTGKKLAKQVSSAADLDIFSQRALPKQIELAQAKITLSHRHAHPQARTAPIELSLPYLRWQQSETHWVAYVPALSIEVITTEKLFQKDLESDIEFCLKRTGKGKDLLQLAILGRPEKIEIERLQWNPVPHTTKSHYKEHYEDEDEKSKILSEIGDRLWAKNLKPAYERDAEVAQLLANFTSKFPASILLVGPSGVGKTATLHQLIIEHHSKLNKFWQSSGSRLVAGQMGYGMWQQRCRDLVNEIKSEPVILVLGNLFELMQVGQSSSTKESIASFLRPYILRGDILVVCECTPEQYFAIESHDANILDVFRSFPIQESSTEKSLEILQKMQEDLDSKELLNRTAIKLILSLHQRFSRYSSLPGKPIQFLRSLVEKNPLEAYTHSEIIQQFATETGLPAVLLDETKNFSLESTIEWFEQNVMAQPEAVKRVVNMLTSVKTRLTRPNKPLGSFVFVGPTGVGKTELAKTLSSYLYGDKNRIVRFDMSEYNSANAGQRLVANSFSQSEGLLTAAVREQPFSIILLDEFEKAAPEVYDLFLQVLGEGRLTDAAGRLADFSNAIIIMTSNLGASSYGKGGLGFVDNSHSPEHAEQHFTSALKTEVRPEFFNRIDHIVPFFPLNLDAIKKIAKRELSNISKRDGIYFTKIELSVAQDLLEKIIIDGYDIRYGARPLKRAIETQLLIPAAKYINDNPDRQNGVIHLLEKDQKVEASFSFREDSSTQSLSENQQKLDRLSSLAKSRKLLHKLSSSSILGEHLSEIQRIEKRILWEKKKALKELGRTNINRRKKNLDSVHVDFDPKQQARHAELKTLVEKVTKSAKLVTEQEESSLLHYYEGTLMPTAEKLFSDKEIEQLIIETFALHLQFPQLVTLYFLADDFDWLRNLLHLYIGVMHERGANITLGIVYREPCDDLVEKKTNEAGVEEDWFLADIMDFEKFEQELHSKGKGFSKKIKGIALQVQSKESTLLLRNETGLHSYEFAKKKYHRCYISTFHDTLKSLRFSKDEVQGPLSLKKIAVRREYSFDHKYHDAYLAKREQAVLRKNLLDELLSKSLLKDAISKLD